MAITGSESFDHLKQITSRLCPAAKGPIRILGFVLQCIIAVLFSVTAVGQSLAQSPPIKVAYVDFYPYTYTDSTGKPAGLLIDITSQVLKEAGLKASYVKMPLPQMFDLINRGDMDLAHLIQSFPVWKDKVIFGQTVLTKIHLDAYSNAGLPTIKSLADFRGKQVIVLRGYTYGYIRDYLNFPENRVVTLRVNDHREAFELLKRRPKAYLLDYRRPAQQEAEKMGLTALKSTSVEAMEINWAVSKKAENARRLLQTLESTYAKMVWEERLTPID